MKNLILLFGLALVTISCSKENDDSNASINPDENQEVNSYPEDEVTAHELLHNSVDKKWISKEFNLSTVGAQICRLDDEIVFFADNKYSYSNGEVKCGGDVDSKEGVFILNFENKQLIFDEGTSEERIADIVSLSNNRIVVTGGWSVYQIKAIFITE